MSNQRKFSLSNHYTNEILYEGYFISIKQCVESAVSDGVCLDGVDLSFQNLACGNFDDVQMSGACLIGANLSGANMSESVFDNADFSMCDLRQACFSVSSLMNVNFSRASFSQTDLTDSIIRHCLFSCPSVFGCSFQRAATFSDCIYMDDDFGSISMKEPPVRITGLPRDIVYLDDFVKIEHDFISKQDLANAGMKSLSFLYGVKIADYLYPVLKSMNLKNPAKNTFQDGLTAL